MNRFLMIALFAVSCAIAQEDLASKSRFVVQTEIAYSVMDVHRNGMVYDEMSYTGNGDFWLQFGREFRFAKHFSWTPSVGINRNGWDFTLYSHEGKMSYIDPFVAASINAHPFGMGYVDFGFRYGRPTYCFGELDGEKTTDDEGWFAAYSVEGFAHLGVDFKEHFRAGAVTRLTMMDGEAEPHIDMFHVGVFASYLF
ncbi:hypothetical protein [Fibrobacter sp. UWEL]|uniref:hypothetical protein n=1 Tax=Fibrobacter sp. UWEL TaxID=1896209 RepID=UPI0009186CD2|nr:hypothetical protein [Fibrobacter sp. UWEL]SHL05064.1 hypothetical protein SAMN05720468_11243 [Fibrobacter sp. UWEL]